MNFVPMIGRAALLIALAAAAPNAFAAPKAPAKQADQAPAKFGDYLAGRTAQLDHDWRTAGPSMRRAWQGDREDGSLRHDALLFSVLGGDFAGALEVAHAVPTDSSDAPLASFILTLDDIGEARFQAAQTRLAAAPPRGIDRYLTPLLTAWTEVGRARKEQAMAALAPLGEIEGAVELRGLQAAMIAEALGDKAQASSFYGKLLEGKPSTRVLAAAAQFYQRQGQTDQAKATIERFDPDGGSASLRTEMLSRLADKSKTPPAPDARGGAADALYEIAASLSAKEEPDIVPLLYVQLALHLKPNFPSAQILLADMDQRWGRLDDSVAALLAVDEKSELRSTAERLAMGALNKARDVDAAIKLGQAAIKAHPADIDLALFQADLLRQKTRYAEAIAIYDAALNRIPQTSNRRGLALYHRGIAYQQAHQWPRAETDLLAALQLRPDDPGLLNYLAFSWADQGVNLDRARTMLERAIELLPDDGAIIDSLGWVMFRAGDYEDAVKQLERAVSLDSGDATVNDHLGDAYWCVGRKIEARAQWEKAQLMSDDKELSEQIRIKLRDGLDQSSLPRHAAN